MKEILLNTRMTTSPNYKKFVAFVDNEDFDSVSKYNWSADNHNHTIYARAWINGKFVYMHNFISGFDETDHEDRNGLNNRRYNLREATRQQNMFNKEKQKGVYSSIYKGVYFSKSRSRWVARIIFNNKGIFIGRFKDENEAAKAYNMKAAELFGNFSKLNIIL